MVLRWDNADPFGVTQPNQNPLGLGTFTYNPRFTDQVYDVESGLYYNYHRHYDPKTGSYTQFDPIGLAWDFLLGSTYRRLKHVETSRVDVMQDNLEVTI